MIITSLLLQELGKQLEQPKYIFIVYLSSVEYITIFFL